MTIGFSNFLFTRNQIGDRYAVEKRPLNNAIPTYPNVISPSRILSQDQKLMWQRFKQTPELMSTLQIPIMDILGERVQFFDRKGKVLSEERQQKINEFWAKNKGKEVLSSFLFDALLTGEGYLWKGKPNRDDITAALKTTMNNLGVELGDVRFKEILSNAVEDFETQEPKKIDSVASSTMHIIYDELDILRYEQIVHTKMAVFQPDEIIHFRYWRLNGDVHGFSPAEALIMEFMLLWSIKHNMRAYFENGGAPDKAFILPKEMANSPNHNYLVDVLKKYKRVQNRHGNLVFTGELDIKDLQGSLKDMEFKDLALYITSTLAFAWGIPVSRIPFLIGSAATGGDSGGLGEQGYWNRISYMQDSLEDVLNSEFFYQYNLSIRFNRKYKQDEVRDAQTKMMNADAITKYQEILSKCGVMPSKSKVLEMIGWNEEDIEEMPKELNSSEDGNNQRQGFEDNQSLNSEPDKLKRNQTKSDANKRQDTGEALYKP